jgi:thiosulfate/3-mercaptopyruvate sulfurtransferase
MPDVSSPIVSPDWLMARLEQPNLVILEVARFAYEESAYPAGHIPGSHWVHWKGFSWDETERRFPDSAEMARRLGALGVGDDTTLVLVGDTIQFATYPYWVLHMAGQTEGVVILDGGHQTWEAEGRPMTTDVPEPRPPAERSVTRDDRSSLVGREDVLAHLGDGGRTLLDMRSDEEFTGERVSPYTSGFDHGAERKGRIPGAVHLYYERLLDDTGRFKDAEGIQAELAAAGVDGETDIITYCRLSHRASLGWLALTRLASRNNVRIYDGSWTEWGSMVGMPIER